MTCLPADNLTVQELEAAREVVLKRMLARSFQATQLRMDQHRDQNLADFLLEQLRLNVVPQAPLECA